MSLFDFTRYILILAVSGAAAFGLPVITPIGAESLIPVMLIFSLLIVFLINRAMERKKQLNDSVLVELSRLRRIKHMTEGISDGVWRKKVYDALERYQKKLSENFASYGQTLGSFRDLTHLIYRFEPKNRYEELILDDLLATTRNLALERQHIEARLSDRLLPSSWLIILTVAIFLLIVLAANRTSEFGSKLETVFGLAAIILALDFLYQRNRWSGREFKIFQNLYKKNIAKTKE